MTNEQLVTMEAGAPLLVDEYRKLQGELHETIGENADLEVERRKWEERAITAEHGWYEAERQRKILEASYEDLRLRYVQREAQVKHLTDPLVKAELAKLPAPIVLHKALVEAANKVADAWRWQAGGGMQVKDPGWGEAHQAHGQLLKALGRTK